VGSVVSLTRRRLAVALAAVLVVLAPLTLSASPAVADPYDDKARVDRDLARTRAALETATDRMAAAATALEEVEAHLPLVQRRLAEARGAAGRARAQARATARAAKEATDSARRADAAFTAATRTLEDARDRLSAFSADAYRSSGLADAEAMMAVGNAADMVDGLGYLERLAARQQEALVQVGAARVAAGQAQEAQRRAKGVADEARRKAADALRRAEAVERDAAAAERELTTLAATRAEALKIAAEERADTEARYQELQQESARIAAEIRALANAGGSPVLSGGTRLLMPVRGWMTSGFGSRFHPIYHEWRMHTGVDLAAAGGAAIWAAAAGRVIRAGWNGGYGNFTCVYHGLYNGRGFATCYAHQSAILVSVGQQVQRGQLIGRVGTTGTSTGNHLHFEVRLDGEPVDPVPWLPRCLC